ncbi:VTT domain-containing protein [Terrabacter lapilli]|uniref:VTT domain-containing protein n=1 Tax=Terrabacter lapilli TaxID=436231 RepID=A0ABP5DNY4_9MICO|nr:VTT domain-containing protein [Terrabacter sp.]
MHALAALSAAAPALGPKWMDPTYLLQQYGSAFFVIALVIVFIECGLLFPILPGDSLLFAVGLFIATGQIGINLGVAIAALTVAAFLGNVVGYEIGRGVGKPLYTRQGRFVNTANFDKTNAFFDRYGSRALVLGRFVPIVRTFITVVAGIGRMHRRRFFTWSAVGAVAWVLSVTLLGYFLGQVFPGLTKNIEYAILLVVLVSVLPMVYEVVKHRREAKAVAAEGAEGVEGAGAAGEVSDPVPGSERG